MDNKLKERMLRNSGSKSILTEGYADTKLAELEIKDKATRIISTFQRDVLSLAQYIDKGCTYSYSRDNATEPSISEEDLKKFKDMAASILLSKAGTLADFVKTSFQKDEDDEEETGKEVEIAIASPEMAVAQAPSIEKTVNNMFGY